MSPFPFSGARPGLALRGPAPGGLTRRGLLLAPPLALALAGRAGPARAGTLEVAPIILDIPPGQNAAALSVANRNPYPIAVQLRGFHWSQPEGRDLLQPSNDLLLSPPLFQLPPGATQTVRLLLKGGATGRQERSFRLLVDEIPRPGEEGQIRFALRLSLPVFARPPGQATAQVDWYWLPDGQLAASNRGLRRARQAELRLLLPGAPPQTLAPSDTPYLLAGAERRWRIDRPRGASLAGAVVTGQSDAGPFRAEIQARAEGQGHAPVSP